MLLVYTGTDVSAAKHALGSAIQRILQDIRGANVIRFDEETFTTESALDALAEGNLFAEKNIVVFDNILTHPDGEDFYLSRDLQSEHYVFIRETQPKKPILSRFSKNSEVYTFMLPKEEKKVDYSAFALTDAAMIRDKKNAWVEFEKSRRRGEAMEAIHGMLFWAFKTLVAIATLAKDDVLASGVKAFSYSKGLSGAKKYTNEELVKKLDDLKDMYHRAHRGECDLEFSLEQFLLKL
jgi:DNA polymerase III delta subunit